MKTLHLLPVLLSLLIVGGCSIQPITPQTARLAESDGAIQPSDVRSTNVGRLELALRIVHPSAVAIASRRLMAMSDEIEHLMIRLMVDGQEVSPTTIDAETGLPGYKFPVQASGILPVSWNNLPAGHYQVIVQALDGEHQVLNASTQGDVFEADIMAHRSTRIEGQLLLKETEVAAPTGSISSSLTLVNSGVEVYDGTTVNQTPTASQFSLTPQQMARSVGKAYTAWASLDSEQPELAEYVGPVDILSVTNDAANPGKLTMILSILDTTQFPNATRTQKLYFDGDTEAGGSCAAVSSYAAAPSDREPLELELASTYDFKRNAAPTGSVSDHFIYREPSTGRRFQVMVGSDGALLGLALWNQAGGRVLRIERLSP